MTTGATSDEIELRVLDLTQLFHTLDPYPFRARDLDKDAEDYIVGWARELPSHAPIRIAIHHHGSEMAQVPSKNVPEAVTHYFEGRAQAMQREINELFRYGRHAILVGVVILGLCLSAAHLTGLYISNESIRSLVKESFLILGWVANWRPLEIFLYDWWPLARQRDLYRRLAQAEVRTITEQ